MSAIELKLEIIKRITTIDNESILKEILQIINLEQALEKEFVLSENEIKAVQKGLEDIEAGRVYSSEVADMKLKEWLKK